MKILHIAEAMGDASSSAILLHQILAHRGVVSYIAFAKMDERKFCAGSLALFKAGAEQLGLTEELLSEAVKDLLAQVDVIHLHTADDRILVNVLPYIKALHKPVVWSMASCSPYTGGCQQGTLHCDLWQQGCLSCPLAAGEEERSARQRVFAAKAEKYKGLQLHPVGMNAWQAGQLRRSIIGKTQAYQLPLLVDRNCFYPDHKSAVRELLGLPQQSYVVVYQDAGQEMAQGLAQAFLSFKDYIVPVCLIHLGGAIQFEDFNENVRNVASLDAAARAMYFRAADLYINLKQDSVCREVLEAAACACPSLIRTGGCASELITEETGFVLPQEKPIGEGLWECLLKIVKNQPLSTQLGQKAYQKFRQEHDPLLLANGFIKLYRTLLPADIRALDNILLCQQEIKVAKEQMKATPAAALAKLFADHARAFAASSHSERRMFADAFCLECLATDFVKSDPLYIWEMVKLWLAVRQDKDMMFFASPEEKEGCLKLMRQLRECLRAYFCRVSLHDFSKVDAIYGETILLLWRRLFLKEKSLLNIAAKTEDSLPDFSAYPILSGYPYVFLTSMYLPYWEGMESWSVQTIVQEKMPLSLRLILMLWLTALPLYGGTERNRRLVLHYIKEFCREVPKNPVMFNQNHCEMLLCDFMGILWRVSYLGGNNIDALRAYGAYLQNFVKRFMAEFSAPIRPRQRKVGEKLRIGYVSLRFKNQAVSQYMANRIFCHDREKFHLKTFMLFPEQDSMTQRIAAASDEFVTFPNVNAKNAVAVFAKAIKDSELDLLIYADIGMDNITYQLGAMRLAPVQAVLVGHGTTTGLSTMDYYISGDHEPQDAGRHYVEKLIRLPKLGCVQLPPQKTARVFSRAEIGVPDDAVLFISCANGLKHVPDRDAVLVEILRQAENAYIVLKPFQNSVSVDQKFIDRLMLAAKKAGVEKRLIFVPPLQHPGDLMGLLVVADVQLDTYPYGGWTTNLEALYYDLPIVTQEGDMARNRWGAGLLRTLGIKAGIAQDETSYVKWAVRFAKEADLRRNVAAAIKQRAKSELFDGPSGQAVYEKTLRQLCR